jgi:phosphoribosylanthranilate isomerase
VRAAMWIKICGNTNLEDTLLAAESGAHAVGFIFAPSPRQVDRETVRNITPKLPAGLETYGVFVDAGFEEIVATVTTCGLTGVQLHKSSDQTLTSRLREQLRKASILSVVRYQADDFERSLTQAARDKSIDGILVDSFSSKAVGGTGIAFDWQQARRGFLGAASPLRLIAAGGLTPENVTQAIETLQPWGVDVVSGVESAPGKKDPARVRAFIQSAQEAAKREELRA